MILIAVNASDPKDIPAKVMLEFPDQITCEHSRQSISYWIKFDNFKVEAKCVKK